MCGRFVQIIDIDLFMKRFGLNRPADRILESNYNVAPGDLAYVITHDFGNYRSCQRSHAANWSSEITGYPE